MPKITALPAAAAANLTDLLAAPDFPFPVTEKLTIGQIQSSFYGSEWDVYITKTADQSVTNSTVLANDLELFTPVLANTLYLVQLVLLYNGTNTGVDYKFQFQIPAIAGGNRSQGWVTQGNATLTPQNIPTSLSNATWPPVATVCGVVVSPDTINMIATLALRTIGAGTLQYLFACQIGGATVTTLAGSTLSVKKLSP